MTTEQLDGQLDLLAELNAQECDTCSRLAIGGSVSCGAHQRGPMYEWHNCSVCPGRYYGVPLDKDYGSSIHYGPVSVRWCRPERYSAAMPLFRQQCNDYQQQRAATGRPTPTTQEA